jgi:hypothetical protein
MVHVEEPSSRAGEARKGEKFVQETWGGGIGCCTVLVGHIIRYQVVQSMGSHTNATGLNTALHIHALPGNCKETHESGTGGSRRQIYRIPVYYGISQNQVKFSLYKP